jgi:hypothetical protein
MDETKEKVFEALLRDYLSLVMSDYGTSEEQEEAMGREIYGRWMVRYLNAADDQ